MTKRYTIEVPSHISIGALGFCLKPLRLKRIGIDTGKRLSGIVCQHKNTPQRPAQPLKPGDIA